jgi:hypothetical protein
MMCHLLIQEHLPAFVLLSVVQHELDAGLLVEVPRPQHVPFGNIRILAPKQERSVALSLLDTCRSTPGQAERRSHWASPSFPDSLLSPLSLAQSPLG